jgi:hypothetical protein
MNELDISVGYFEFKQVGNDYNFIYFNTFSG